MRLRSGMTGNEVTARIPDAVCTSPGEDAEAAFAREAAATVWPLSSSPVRQAAHSSHLCALIFLQVLTSLRRASGEHSAKVRIVRVGGV